jgi:peroxiredoxin
MRTVCALAAAAMLLSGQSLSNRRAPSFSLPDTALKQHDLLDYRGKWLLLDFMMTNCPHCKELTGKLEDVKKKFGARMDVLAVVVTPPETQATVAKYVAETKSTAPIVFDQGQVAVSYFRATPSNPAFDTPHLFAINPQGQIVRDWSQGEMEQPTFLPELERVLAGASASQSKAK